MVIRQATDLGVVDECLHKCAHPPLVHASVGDEDAAVGQITHRMVVGGEAQVLTR